MLSSVKAFTTGIIDYAGLFPPAGLSMEKAFLNYAAYRNHNDRWMLSRFVCPSARLSEIDKYADVLREGPPFRFAVLAGAARDVDSYLPAIKRTIDEMTGFYERHPGRVMPDVLETRLPAQAVKQKQFFAIRELLRGIEELFAASDLPAVQVYYEAPMDDNWADSWPRVVEAIALHNREIKNRDAYLGSAFKLRCGGVEAQQYPTPEQVAAAITWCRDARVKMKATAGLHHPLRHYNEEAGVTMHGFINVFGAAMLARYQNLSAETLQEVIADEMSQHFVFSENGLNWCGHQVSVADIAAAREAYITSFGCCSFDDPREDLAAMRLM